MESIYEYVSNNPASACASTREPADEVPHESVDDYINTLR